MSDLTDTERAMLALERTWFAAVGAKEQAIRDRFDLSATQYYQLLLALIERPEALAYDPLTVKRLLRLRELRRAARRRPA